MKLFALNLIFAFGFGSWAGGGPGLMIAGFVAGWGVLWLACTLARMRARYFRISLQSLVLTVYFIKELLLSSIRVARDAFARNPDLKTGIVRMPLETDDDLEIFILSGLITLTPGTLTLDVAPDKSFLLIHSLYAGDPPALVEELKSGMEHRVREVFR